MAKAIFTNDAAISLLVKENPKRGASKERFAAYFKSKTVADFLHHGGTRADVLWDAAHGYIAVAGLDVAVKQPAKQPETKKVAEPKSKAPSKKAAKAPTKTKEMDNAWPFKQPAVGKVVTGTKAKAAAKLPSKAKVTKPAAQAAA